MTTAENQRCADERLPVLLQVKAQVWGVSVEPMLGPIDNLRQALGNYHVFPGGQEISQISWVIVGAESGPNRRPFCRHCAEDVYRQCQAAGVPFFGKQDSGLRPGVPLLIHGQEIKEFPKT
jgi:protein gp37